MKMRALFLILSCAALVCAGQQKPGVRTVENGGGVTVVAKQAGTCSALAPQDWMIQPGPDGQTADLADGSGTTHVAWGIRGVNSAMRPYYGDMFGDPDTAHRATLQLLLRSGVTYTSAAKLIAGYFLAREFDAGRVHGVVVYHVYSPPPGMAPGSYIISAYYAYADKSRPQSLATAIAVMTSLRCVAQLRLPAPSSPGHGSSGSASHKSRGESGELEGYNVQLGTQYAHSPSTGQNFLLDRSTAWNDNGPQGAGYYRSVGNSYEKLEVGRSD